MGPRKKSSHGLNSRVEDRMPGILSSTLLASAPSPNAARGFIRLPASSCRSGGESCTSTPGPPGRWPTRRSPWNPTETAARSARPLRPRRRTPRRRPRPCNRPGRSVVSCGLMHSDSFFCSLNEAMNNPQPPPKVFDINWLDEIINPPVLSNRPRPDRRATVRSSRPLICEICAIYGSLELSADRAD